MLSRTFLLALALTSTGLCSVLPNSNVFGAKLVARAPTPDNTCGGTNGYTCVANAPNGGPCCSSSGYCGTTAAYCGLGCQPAFGTCTPTTPGDGTSTAECGPTNGGARCVTGMCCSSAGWCGTTAAYCGAGCQTGWGTCTGASSTSALPTSTTKTGTATSTPSSTATNISTNGRCGAGGANKICPGTQCCSAEGYCGTTGDYCTDPDCQWQFGTCDSSTTPAGPTTLNDARPKLGTVPYGADLYDCTQAKTVALTFDDGPGPYTAQLLDILKQYKFKATFFITGNNLHKGPIDTTATWNALIKRMIAEGHQVASHTWSHYDLSVIPHDQRLQQMVKNERALANIIGKYPTYMRPPYSSCTPASGCVADLNTLGYHITYFDLDTQDYLNDSPVLIQNSKNIVNDYLFGSGKAATNYLSIQHDIHQQSVQNLTSYYFDRIVAKGWTGTTVGACLNDPEANWYRTKAAATKKI